MAKNHTASFMGVNVQPTSEVVRLRMARAEQLGRQLAKHLLSSGADRILEEIRTHAKSNKGVLRTEKSP